MRIKNHKGFTFIELIMVLVVATIIGVIVLSRLMSPGTELIAQTDVIKAHLRYAQASAMGSDKIRGIHCDGDFYWLYKEGNIGNRVILPGEKKNTDDNVADVANANKVRLSEKGISNMEPFTMSFDDMGVPHTDATATDGNELTSGHSYSQITVSSGGNNQTITITPNTGFIP
jgi:prepilin-type N-terminal cleavage/methylation domain-containing protein